MKLSEKITKLSDMYYHLMIDHHKDRDCHFVIYENSYCKKWSYGREVKDLDFSYYTVSHYGYINEYFEENFDTLAEAEKFLYEKLYKYVNNELECWLNINEENAIDKYQLDQVMLARPMLLKIKEDLEYL